MAKKIERVLKLEIEAGNVNPATIGPTLGAAGVNIGEFTNQFNAATQEIPKGQKVRAELQVFDDRTFNFILKTSPTSTLILKVIGKDKGSGKNLVSKAGKLSQAQLRSVAEEKMGDLNTNDVEQAMKVVAGTARSMGVEVEQ